MSDFLPDYLKAEVQSSPNFGVRVGECPVSIVVLHYTGMQSGEAAQQWLCNPESQVSCHYIVHEDGRVVQMVRESDRAWHAGKSSWRGITDMNSASIGIEIVNPGHEFGYVDFPEAQMLGVIDLTRDIVRRHRIDPTMVLGHSDVAPGRKVDPGERFNWARLSAIGLGHFVAATPLYRGKVLGPGDQGEQVQNYQSMLALYGYGLEVSGDYDERTSTVTAAFQRHFRPRKIDGLADFSTRDTLVRLVQTLPASMK